MFKRGEPNDAGVFGARRGNWRGTMSVFTHRNPKNGTVWGEDIPVMRGGRIVGYGAWVPYDEVKFI